MSGLLPGLLPGLALILSGCAPALDWRDIRPADSHVQALFPCRPTTQSRQVKLAGQPVKLQLHACAAGGQTWALAHADLGDPTRIGQALDELRLSAAANLDAQPGLPAKLQVPGATPHAGSGRMRLSGRLPDGQPVVEQVAVFTWGTTVYQATALGESLSDEAADIFIGALRVLP